jgi:hypothetical protein
VKRQLSKEEKAFTLKNLETQKVDLEYTKAQIKRIDTAIDIAPIVYKHQVKQMYKEKQQYEELVKDIEEIIKVSEKQIREGVESKDA